MDYKYKIIKEKDQALEKERSFCKQVNQQLKFLLNDDTTKLIKFKLQVLIQPYSKTAGNGNKI